MKTTTKHPKLRSVVLKKDLGIVGKSVRVLGDLLGEYYPETCWDLGLEKRIGIVKDVPDPILRLYKNGAGLDYYIVPQLTEKIQDSRFNIRTVRGIRADNAEWALSWKTERLIREKLGSSNVFIALFYGEESLSSLPVIPEIYGKRRDSKTPRSNEPINYRRGHRLSCIFRSRKKNKIPGYKWYQEIDSSLYDHPFETFLEESLGGRV